MTSLRLHLFGTFKVIRNGVALSSADWRSRQTRTLLRVLAARYGQVAPADQLLEILWPDAPPDVSRSRLHVRISQLRRLLDPEASTAFVQTVEEGYCLADSADCWVDVREFERLAHQGRQRQEDRDLAGAAAVYEAAQALYRGDFLAEDLYADWAFAERERLREAFLTLLTELAEVYAQQGRFRRAIATCHAILQRDPCRETAYLRLMLYHYYAGERPQALQSYERCRQVLAAELGVSPLPETDMLAEQIRAGTLWQTEEAPHYPPPIFEGRLYQVPYSLGNPPLVGREREYAWVVERWRDPATCALLLEGEAGVGKSRLAEELIGFAATQECPTFSMRLTQPERMPLTAVVAALRPRLAAVKALDPAEQTLLAPFFPELGSESVDDHSPVGQRERVLATLNKLFDTCFPAGALFLVDDAHRLGSASLEFLVAQSGRLTLLLTCRTEETPAEHPLRLALRPLDRANKLAALRLKPLSLDSLQELVRRLANSELPALAESVAVRSEGSPLFALALLQTLFEEGALYVDSHDRWALAGDPQLALPPGVRQAIEGRLQRLTPAVRQVFDLAAVVGGEFDFSLLQLAGRFDEDALLDALDSLLKVGLLLEPRRHDRAEYVISHDRYAEVGVQMLPSARRRRLHRQVAAGLDVLHGDAPAFSADLAYHYSQGGQLAEASQYALRAGRYALLLYAGQQAIDHLQAALDWADSAGHEFPRQELGEIHQGLGEALRYAGRYEEAVEHFSQALPFASGAAKLAVAFHLIAIPAIRGGSLDEVDHLLPLLEKELAGSDSWPLATLRWVQGFLGAIRHGARARSATAEGWWMARRLAARNERPPSWVEGWSYMSLARSHDRWGEWRRTVRYASRSLEIYRRNDDRYGMAASHVTLAAGYYGLGVYEQALEQCRLCLDLATEAEDPRWHSEALYIAGQVHLERDDLAAAAENGRQVVVVAGCSGDLLRQGLGSLLLVRVALRQGEIQTVAPVLHQLEAQAQAADGLAYRVLMRRYLAEALLLLGDPLAAEESAREGLEWAEHCAMKREQGGLHRILGLALAASGQLAAGRGEIEKALVLARRIGCSYDQVLAQRALGQS